MSFTRVNPSYLSTAHLQQRSALGDTSLTTNSIAPRADSMPASGSKRFKNRAITSQKIKNHENPNPNRTVAGIDTVQGAIQLIVNDALSNEKGKGYKSYLRLRIEANQAVLVKASDYPTESNPFQPWDFDPNTFAAGADSAMYEKGGKTFVVYLQQEAAKASKIVLNIAGQVGQGLKAILGDRIVDANGASIELTEGQTQVSFALISDSDISADQAGSITVSYQGSGGSGSGSNATSNSWGLTLKDAGEIENTLQGDFLVKTEKANSDIKRYNREDQEIIVVKKDELYYVRDGQGNPVKGSDQPTRKRICPTVDSQTVITTNSIALRSDSMPAKCQKRFQNRRKTSQKAQNCKKSKPNRPFAGTESARGAMEFVVTTSNTQKACEVQHG